MGRGIDAAKWAAWRKRLARFERSDLTISAFCLAENVSMGSFFQWRRKLAGDSDATAPHEAPLESPTFLPVRVESAAPLEIDLPNGARIRVVTRDVAAIEAVVAAVGRLARSGDEESSRC